MARRSQAQSVGSIDAFGFGSTDPGFGRDIMSSLAGSLAVRLGTALMGDDAPAGVPRLPPLGRVDGLISFAGEDVDGVPTVGLTCLPPVPEGPAVMADRADLYCYMGADAPAGRRYIRLPPVGDASLAAVLPGGCVAWCRDGSTAWTWV